MKDLFYLSILTFIALIFISSCKKQESVQNPNPIITYLCTGKGSSSYYPLAINNEWTYPSFFNNTKLVFIRQNKTIGTHTYFNVQDNYGSQYGCFREDTNGDILTVDTTTTAETVIIPGDPTLNEEWLYPTGSKKITSIIATVITNDCTYSDCLEFTYKDQSGNITSVEYYKRGIGKVSYKTYPPPGLGNPIQWNLINLLLN
jgi:hypothetical protein